MREDYYDDEEDDVYDEKLKNYDKNEISPKTAIGYFCAIAGLIVLLFLLNTFHILPNWCILIASCGIVILCCSMKLKK